MDLALLCPTEAGGKIPEWFQAVKPCGLRRFGSKLAHAVNGAGLQDCPMV